MGNFKIKTAAGAVYDLESFMTIETVSGAGMAPVEVLGRPWGILPGEYHDGERVAARTIIVGGTIRATDLPSYYQARAALIDIIKPDGYPRDGIRSQPLYLQYVGSGRTLEIPVVYAGGLEENWDIAGWATEKIAMRFIAQEQPFWAPTADTTTAMTTAQSLAVYCLVGRMSGVGWSAMGLTAAGGTPTIAAIAEDATYIYIGGAFTSINGIANTAYVARRNKSTGVWSALGTGMNGAVNVLYIGPNGYLYAGGSFTTAGGGGANYIAVWNGSAWSALGTGMNALVYDIKIGPTGTLYACGNFTTAGGGAAARIASWDGSSWSALGAGLGAAGRGMAIDWAGNLYVGGDFTTAGGATANYIAVWNGATWATLSTGMDALVYKLTFGADGTLYMGGNFTTAGGISASKVVSWNGVTFRALGAGFSSAVTYVHVAGGLLYAGTFDNASVWNGYVWNSVPFVLPSSSTVLAILLTTAGDLLFGFNTTGTATVPYANTITLSSGAETYPTITIKRTGGTSATLLSIRNELTGREMLFNVSLLDGETITINLSQKTVISSFGRRLTENPLRGSDFANFNLSPGSNPVDVFVNPAGSPTITANIIYRQNYWTMDAAV